MVFEGSKFCPHCGAALARRAEGSSSHSCPRCESSKLGRILLGDAEIEECAGCHGLWIQTSTFERICADRERQSAVLGSAAEVPRGGAAFEMSVRYLRCPECRKLMNRVNFAKCSGVILDACRAHGTWFDENELRRIVEFIRSGGMDLARQKEKAELEAARRRLEAERNRAGERTDIGQSHHSSWGYSGGTDLGEVIAHVGSAFIDHIFHH
jgi:Zn-finger nucleic acid-binding protein